MDETIDEDSDSSSLARRLGHERYLERDYAQAARHFHMARQLRPGVESVVNPYITVCLVMAQHTSDRSQHNNGFVDFYKILGVVETAELGVIKEAYHRMALALHPDKNPVSEAVECFKIVKQAAETLLDEKKRSAYDYFRRQSRGTISIKQPSPPTVPSSAAGAKTAASGNTLFNVKCPKPACGRGFFCSLPPTSNTATFTVKCPSCGAGFQCAASAPPAERPLHPSIAAWKRSADEIARQMATERAAANSAPPARPVQVPTVPPRRCAPQPPLNLEQVAPVVAAAANTGKSAKVTPATAKRPVMQPWVPSVPRPTAAPAAPAPSAAAAAAAPTTAHASTSPSPPPRYSPQEVPRVGEKRSRGYLDLEDDLPGGG